RRRAHPEAAEQRREEILRMRRRHQREAEGGGGEDRRGATGQSADRTSLHALSPNSQFTVDVGMFRACRPEGSVVAAGRLRTGSPPLAISGTFFGSTTTLAPILTRLNRSVTSSLVMRMQPE